MRKFKIIHDISTSQHSQAATLPSAIGHVFLKPHLYQFLVKREQLDPQSPILYLSRNTLICRALRRFCNSPETFKERFRKSMDKKIYSRRIRFIPLDIDADRLNYLLDEQDMRDFNDFLHEFMTELLTDSIHKHLNALDSDGNAKTAIIEFLEKYGLEDELDWESLKKAEYRLRHRRI